jgi:hypothetical protein
MKVDVDVTVDTKATAKFIMVNFKNVVLNGQGVGTVSVDANADNILQWGFVGAPGTAYTITINPNQGTLKIGGQHPIVLQIPQGFQQAAGHRRFRIVVP